MKNLLNYVPLHLLVGLVFGMLFQFHFHTPISLVSCLFLVLFLIALGGVTKRFFGAVMGSFFLLGMLSIALHMPFLEPSSNSNAHQLPCVLKVEDLFSSNAFREKYIAQTLESEGLEKNTKVMLVLERDSLRDPLKSGAVLVCFGALRAINDPIHPFAFDLSSYMKSKGVFAQLSVEKEAWRLLASNEDVWKGRALEYREYLSSILEKHLENIAVKSITEAMLLGNKDRLSKETKQVFADAGVIHILAISGLHIGVLVLLLNFILKPMDLLPKGRGVRFFTGVLLLGMYAFLTGLSPSVVRSVVQFSFLNLGFVFLRRQGVVNAVISSAFFLLLFHPFYLFDLGFQMSYLAVFSIVFFQPILAHLWKPKTRFFRYLWTLITVSLAAQLGLFSITVFYFHQFPGLFLLANTVMVPFLGLILAWGFLILILGGLGLLPGWVSGGYSFLMERLLGFVSWVARQRDFVFEEIYLSKPVAISLFVLVLLGMSAIKFRRFFWLRSLFIGILLFQGHLIFDKFHRQKRKEWVVFQQFGGSSLLEVNNGKAHLYSTDLTNIKKQVRQYTKATGIQLLTSRKDIPGFFDTGEQRILVVDRRGQYQIPSFKNQWVWLREAPRINLERMIEDLRPGQIIADGSNYPDQIQRWKATCEENKVPFHATSISGAFVVSP